MVRISIDSSERKLSSESSVSSVYGASLYWFTWEEVIFRVKCIVSLWYESLLIHLRGGYLQSQVYHQSMVQISIDSPERKLSSESSVSSVYGANLYWFTWEEVIFRVKCIVSLWYESLLIHLRGSYLQSQVYHQSMVQVSIDSPERKLSSESSVLSVYGTNLYSFTWEEVIFRVKCIVSLRCKSLLIYLRGSYLQSQVYRQSMVQVSIDSPERKLSSESSVSSVYGTNLYWFTWEEVIFRVKCIVSLWCKSLFIHLRGSYLQSQVYRQSKVQVSIHSPERKLSSESRVSSV